MPTDRVRSRSGNVFADIKVPNAGQYLAKAELAARIFQIIQDRRLTQAEAGKVLGITQSKVSALLSGRLAREARGASRVEFGQSHLRLRGFPWLAPRASRQSGLPGRAGVQAERASRQGRCRTLV